MISFPSIPTIQPKCQCPKATKTYSFCPNHEKSYCFDQCHEEHEKLYPTCNVIENPKNFDDHIKQHYVTLLKDLNKLKKKSYRHMVTLKDLFSGEEVREEVEEFWKNHEMNKILTKIINLAKNDQWNDKTIAENINSNLPSLKDFNTSMKNFMEKSVWDHFEERIKPEDLEGDTAKITFLFH
jgi:hypothetical protein